MKIQGRQTDSLVDPFSISVAVPLAQAYADMGLRQYNELAETFRDTVNGTKEKGVFDASGAIAAATVLALAAELLLKIANFQAGGSYPRGHDLSALVKSLPAEEIGFLRHAYAHLLDKNPNLLSFKIQLLSGESPEPAGPAEKMPVVSFDDAVAHAAPLFIKLRYLYEHVTCGFDSSIDFRCILPLVNALLALVTVERSGPRWTIFLGEGGARGYSDVRGDF